MPPLTNLQIAAEAQRFGFTDAERAALAVAQIKRRSYEMRSREEERLLKRWDEREDHIPAVLGPERDLGQLRGLDDMPAPASLEEAERRYVDAVQQEHVLAREPEGAFEPLNQSIEAQRDRDFRAELALRVRATRDHAAGMLAAFHRLPAIARAMASASATRDGDPSVEDIRSDARAELAEVESLLRVSERAAAALQEDVSRLEQSLDERSRHGIPTRSADEQTLEQLRFGAALATERVDRLVVRRAHLLVDVTRTGALHSTATSETRVGVLPGQPSQDPLSASSGATDVADAAVSAAAFQDGIVSSPAGDSDVTKRPEDIGAAPTASTRSRDGGGLSQLEHQLRSAEVALRHARREFAGLVSNTSGAPSIDAEAAADRVAALETTRKSLASAWSGQAVARTFSRAMSRVPKQDTGRVFGSPPAQSTPMPAAGRSRIDALPSGQVVRLSDERSQRSLGVT